MKKANTQPLTSDLMNAIIIAMSHVFSEHVSGAPGIDLYLMFTSNRALVVLISSGDKTSRCQVYYSVKNSVLSALHISTAAPVEKMQREMHRCSQPNSDQNSLSMKIHWSDNLRLHNRRFFVDDRLTTEP